MLSKIEIINKILEINKYEKLNPMQNLAKEHIGENTLITTPTASGKTTVFEMYMLDCLLNKKKKAIYISPLKALTTEHYLETKRKYSKELDVKIGLSTGDLDSSNKYLEQFDVLFLTYEKFDSILRHQPSWIKNVGLLTIDEIHEIGSNRGSTLEVIITQLKHNFKEIVLLGLSATIKNSKEIADWLSAKLVLSNYRPVPLETGVFYNDSIYFEDRKEDLTSLAIKNINLGSIIKDTINKEKQIIVFCASRKNAMSFAKKYGKIITNSINTETYKKLREASKNALEALENPTKQCEELSLSLLMGSAFHHAGLVYKQREIVEENFKKGNIKAIFATPTLAAGINLPAYRVVINSVFRFSEGSMVPIPVNEFQQMAGRAGRPKYDKKGEAICVVNKETDIPKIYNTYILSGPSNIDSQLSKINILRGHLLSMILVNNLEGIDQLVNYLSKTFYYFVYGDNNEIRKNIQEIVYEFYEYGFLEKKENGFKITSLGKKVCYLYIDPLSANNILKDLEVKKNKDTKTIEKIFTVSNTSEMYPYLKYKQDKENNLFVDFENVRKNVFFDYEDIYLLQKIYLSKMINDWIEKEENNLIEEYNTTPGQIRDLMSRAEWICHSTVELLKHTQSSIIAIKEYSNLLLRLKYGIKQELVPLVELRNIGRVRSRRLFNSGFKGVQDIINNPDGFINIVGKIGIDTLKELKIDYQEKTINEKINKE